MESRKPSRAKWKPKDGWIGSDQKGILQSQERFHIIQTK